MISSFIKNVNLIPAALDDYPLIQNMARFYIYDLSRYCGFESDEYNWTLPQDGLYAANDYKKYFIEADRKAYLIKVNNEIAGFVLLNKIGTTDKLDWNMAQFFILARFQNKGIGKQVAQQIWQMHQGIWEVSALPENKPAIIFWRNVINEFIKGNYQEEIKLVQVNDYKAERVIFEFDTQQHIKTNNNNSIRFANSDDIDAMVALSYTKRRAYEKVQPQFWRYKEGAEKLQAKWFKELLLLDDYIMLIAESENKIIGFIIGKIIEAPEVYNPKGLTLMVDDFCVKTDNDWFSVGNKLVEEIKARAKVKNASQILVVCGGHDKPKRLFLKSIGLNIASEWYVSSI